MAVPTTLFPQARNVLLGLTVAALLGAADRGAAQTVVYNLANDWSDVSNPNGVWQLNKAPGTPFTINQADYWHDGSGQHAWADDYLGQPTHVPLWMKVSGSGIAGFATAGAIVMHTAETSRTGTELSSVTWTAPAGGSVLITGSAWGNKSFSNRPQTWELLVNHVVVTQGDLIFTDSYSQSSPFDFANGSSGAAVLSRSVQPGDVIELLIFRQASSPSGDLVGLNFSVSLTAIPEPGATALIVGGFALGGMLVARVRQRRG